MKISGELVKLKYEALRLLLAGTALILTALLTTPPLTNIEPNKAVANAPHPQAKLPKRQTNSLAEFVDNNGSAIKVVHSKKSQKGLLSLAAEISSFHDRK